LLRQSWLTFSEELEWHRVQAWCGYVRIRHNPALQAFYQRLIGRGRPAKVAIIACMRKLLVILNAILRDHRPWQPA
jgi:transposase